MPFLTLYSALFFAIFIWDVHLFRLFFGFHSLFGMEWTGIPISETIRMAKSNSSGNGNSYFEAINIESHEKHTLDE